MTGAQTSFLDRWAVKAGAFTPRPYQVRADLAIDREFQSHRSTLVCHPTGTGKTVLFCLRALKAGGALVLVHRDTLLQQAASKLAAATGRTVEIEKAHNRAGDSPYVVASVQSLHPKRLIEFKQRHPAFPLIIIDECHRAIAKSYRLILEAYPGAKVLGVTATPDRTDGVGMRNVFESTADEYSLIDATNDGWLTPLRFLPIESKVNLDGIKVVGRGVDRDFDQAELDDAIVQEAGRISETIFRVMERQKPDGRLIVFTPGVKTAHAGAEAMNELRAGCACVVDGEMDDRIKRRVIERHRAGEFQYIFNCNVLTEGHDDPTLYGVVDASPTASRLRAMQRWGRVTRPWPGAVDSCPMPEERRASIAASPKPWGWVFDLTVNSASHDVVVSAVDILAGRDIPDDVRAAAKRRLAREGGTVEDAIKRAEEEAASVKRRARAARAVAKATKVTAGEARSVLDRAGINFIRWTRPSMRPEDHATKAMLGWLQWKRIPIPENCSKRMFHRLRGLEEKRTGKGLVSLGGVEWLRKFGIDGWKMPKVVAERVRDAIVAKGRQSLTTAELAPLMESRVPGED